MRALRPQPPSRRSALTLAALLAAVAPGLAAQSSGTIVGSVYDSTARAPLAEATVLLSPVRQPDVEARAVETDSAGRFAAAGLAPGRWAVTYLHRAADEYGVAPVPVEVDVLPDETSRTAFHLPSPRALRPAVCGQGAADTSAAVVGSVRDEATGRWLAAAGVIVAWRAFDMTSLQLRTLHVRTVTAADGTFRVCGLPSFEPLRVQAGLQATSLDSLASGEIEVPVTPGGIARVHVGVGRVIFLPTRPDAGGPTLGGDARLAGSVRDAGGNPVSGARVRLLGAGRETVTGEGGTFRLDSLPIGSWTVEARAIGLSPARAVVLLRPGASGSVTVRFRRATPTLDRVVVFGRRRRWHDQLMDDFVRRKERGSGYFMTAEEVEREHAVTLTQLFARAPNLRILPGRNGSMVLRGRGGCRPDVYVNGTRAGAGSEELDLLVPPEEVLALEVHDALSGSPPPFAMGSRACVVVGVWTK